MDGKGGHDNGISDMVIGAAIGVDATPGPDLLESMYRKCPVCDLNACAMSLIKEAPLGVRYIRCNT